MKRSYLLEKYFSCDLIITYDNDYDESSWNVMETDTFEPIITPLIIKRENYEK